MLDQDKSKQELVEELAEMRRREAQWRSVIAEMPGFVAVVDRAGTIQYLNHAAPGYSLEDALGKNACDFIDPSFREIASECIERVFDTGQADFYEAVATGPDGSSSSYETFAGPVRVGDQVVAVQLVSNDVTQRKRAEEALREREARLLEAQEVADLGFFVLDIDAGRWTSSPVLDRILGIPSDYEKTVDGWGHLVHPDERQEVLDHLLKEVVGENKPCDREYRIVRFGDKQVRWVHGLGRLQFHSAGQPVALLGTIQDITERKLAEEELAKSKAVLQATIDCLPFNFFAIGLDGRYMLQNAVSKAQQPTDVIGKLPEEVCPNKHDLAIWLDNNRRAFAGEKVEGEVTLSLGGVERFYHNVIVPISDGMEFYGILGVNIDITERKRAEEALTKAHDELEQRVKERTAELATANENLDVFRRFAEDSNEGFGMSDFDGRIVYANSSLSRLFGEEKPEDVIGKNVSSYYPEEYKQRRKGELIPALLRKGHLHIEQTVLPRHGKPLQTLQSTFLIRDKDGNPFRIAVVISDITERKEAEDALRQSEEKYRTLVETSPDAVMMADLEGHLTLASQRAVELCGAENVEELLGRNPLEFFAPEDHQRFLENLHRTLNEGVTTAVEYTFLKKDGSRFSGEASAAAIRAVSGKPTGFVAIVRDITERKQAEDALAKEHGNLKHLLHASDHERQLIAYEIHDGLAQELAGAIMQLDAFDHLKESKPKQAADAYHAAVTMLRQGHSEARRLIAGVRPPILDEEGIVAAVGHLIHEQIRLKGPKIEYHSRVDFDRLDPTLENAIYRIAQEALTNACKHSKSEKILVGLSQGEDRLRIEIRDWGIGFDPEAVPKSHFGLEGIRQRARLLGGKCSIRSTAGKGTRIMVELPVVPRDE